ncbi:MAG: nitrate/nitrite transporter [Candidatus Bathyarchaeia archaeon]
MLTLAFLTAFELHLLLFSYSPLVSQIKLEMELSDTQAGLIFSMSILTLVLLRIPWGLLSDRIGFSTTLRLATTIIAVFGFLRGFAINYETLLIYQLLLGTGFAAILPCLPKLVEAWFQKKVGPTTGVYVAGFPIGEIVGLSFTPYLLASLGNWRNVFHIYGTLGLILTTLWWTMAKEPETSRKEELTHKPTPTTSLKGEFSSVLRMKEVWILTGLCICAMGAYDTIVTWLPRMLELKNIPPETAGFMASMMPLGFLLAGPIIGTFSDRIGLRRPFVWILGLASGPVILAIGLFSDAPLWVAIFLAGFCTTGILTLVLIIPTELPELARLVASSVGVISSLGNIGPFIFPIAVGYLKDITGSFLPAAAMLAVIAETTVILGLLMRETGGKRSNSKSIRRSNP